MSKPYLRVKDFTDDLFKAIKTLNQKETLVGIPAQSPPRKPEPGEPPDPISNAALLYINEFGSAAQNIPARHPMKTGIKLCQDAIAVEFKKCAQAALSSGDKAIDQYYERVGIIASQTIKNVINDQVDMPGPAESTLKSRRSKGFKGDKSLIVTGQLRNAITYVVREK